MTFNHRLPIIENKALCELKVSISVKEKKLSKTPKLILKNM